MPASGQSVNASLLKYAHTIDPNFIGVKQRPIVSTVPHRHNNYWLTSQKYHPHRTHRKRARISNSYKAKTITRLLRAWGRVCPII